jgi:predicted metal-dependent hydrolase
MSECDGISCKVAHRKIKHPRLEFKTGDLLLVFPQEYFQTEKDVLAAHEKWVSEKRQLIKKAANDAQKADLNFKRTTEEFKELVCLIIREIQVRYPFTLNCIYFRTMRTKWGSFSSKKNLTVNVLMKYLPNDLIYYIIFHELAHSLERKHNQRFWNIIQESDGDYRTKEQGLLSYWFLIQKLNPHLNTRI